MRVPQRSIAGQRLCRLLQLCGNQHNHPHGSPQFPVLTLQHVSPAALDVHLARLFACLTRGAAGKGVINETPGRWYGVSTGPGLLSREAPKGY